MPVGLAAADAKRGDNAPAGACFFIWKQTAKRFGIFHAIEVVE